MVFVLNAGTTGRYNLKETTKRVLRAVLGWSVIGTTDSYSSKEPKRTARKLAVESFKTKTELCGRNSLGPASTVKRSNSS